MSPPDSATAKIVALPDLKPATRRDLLRPEIGTQYDSMDRMFAFYGDGGVFLP